jgi:hypothetical protein
LEGEVKVCPSNRRDERYAWFSTEKEKFGEANEDGEICI